MAATRVIFIQTAFLGDLLLSVPTLKNLRQNFANAEITLVCRQGIGSLFKDLDLVDRVFEIKKGDANSYSAVKKSVSNESFDYLICPHESFTSAKLAFSIKASKKITFFQWWNFLFFNDRIEKRSALPESLRQLSLLQKYIPGLQEKLDQYLSTNDSSVPEWASPKVTLPSHASDVVGPLICLFPGSVWETKKWTEEGFIQTGKAYLEKGFDVHIMGGSGEEQIAQRVQEALGSQDPRVQNWAGKTPLMKTMQILEKASLVVTNDSAGQHMAALLEIPTVTIFGPTVLEFGYRAWNNKSVVVENKNLSCRPCGKHGHHQCPIGTHECMKSVSAEAVLLAGESLLRI